jgi:hypothetical protein
MTERVLSLDPISSVHHRQPRQYPSKGKLLLQGTEFARRSQYVPLMVDNLT